MGETRLCVVWRSLRRVRVLTFERRIFSGVLRAEMEVVKCRERRRERRMCILRGWKCYGITVCFVRA